MDQIIQKSLQDVLKIFYKPEKFIIQRHQLCAKFTHGTTLEIGGSDFPNKFLPIGTIMVDVYPPKSDLPANYSRFVKCDSSKISSEFGERSFDSIVCSEVIEHLPNHCQFIIDAYNLLKPNGVLILTSPNPFFISTIFGNIFFPMGLSKSGMLDNKESISGPYFGHIHLHIPRILNQIACLAGFEVQKVKYYLGVFRLFSASVMYIYNKR